MYSETSWLGRIGFEDNPTTAIALHLLKISAIGSAPLASNSDPSGIAILMFSVLLCVLCARTSVPSVLSLFPRECCCPIIKCPRNSFARAIFQSLGHQSQVTTHESPVPFNVLLSRHSPLSLTRRQLRLAFALGQHTAQRSKQLIIFFRLAHQDAIRRLNA